MLTRLLILWLLSESPLHGYRIKRILADRAMRYWFPVFDAAIYSALRSLVKLGYAQVVRTEREGNRPLRTKYRITREGRAYLVELLERAWTELEPPGDAFDVALAARGEIGEERIAPLIHARRTALRRKLTDMEAMRRAAPSGAMVDRALSIARAELRWMNSVSQSSRRSK